MSACRVRRWGGRRLAAVFRNEDLGSEDALGIEGFVAEESRALVARPHPGENALTIQLPLEHTSCQAVEPIAQEGTFYVAGYSVLAEEGKPNRLLGNIHIKLALLSKRDGW